MATMVSMTDPIERRLWTAEEFLDWLEPGKYADLIEGRIYMHSPVNLRHADLLNFVDGLLRSFIEHKHLGRLYREVVAVRLGPRQVFLPDLAFSNDQIPRLAPTHAPMAPVFVVEALSPSSADRDAGPKFALYEAHGVKEYWILDPERQAHRFFRREGELLVEFAQCDPVIRSASVPGFWVERLG